MTDPQWQTTLMQEVRNLVTAASANDVKERYADIQKLSETTGQSIPVEIQSVFNAYSRYREGHLIPAIKEFFDCVSLCQTHNQEYLAHIGYFHIGTIFGLLGDHSHASEFLTKAERVEQFGDQRLLAFIRNNIGDLLMNVEQYSSALKYFEQSLDALNDEELEYKLVPYINIIGVKVELNQLDEVAAISDLIEPHIHGNLRYLSFYHQVQGRYHMARGNFELSETHHLAAIDAIKVCQNDYYLSEMMLDYCYLLVKQSNWTLLDQYLEEGLSYARKVGTDKLIDKYNHILLSRLETMPSGEEKDEHFSALFASFKKSRDAALKREKDYLSQIYQLNMDRLALESAQDINKNLALINRVGQYLSTCDNFRDVLPQLVDDLSNLFTIDTLAIAFYESDKPKLFVEHYYEDNAIKKPTYVDFLQKATFFEYCAKNNSSLYFNDMTAEKKREMLGETSEHDNMSSLLFSPITINGEVKAVFTIQAGACYAYQTYQYELFLQLTNYLSIALKNQLNRHQLTLISQTDHLTKLWNRQSLDAHYRELQNKKQSGYSIIMLDIDCYKQLNDHYGHVKGDEVLITITQQIKEHFKHLSAKCYRYGGDEFAIVVGGRISAKVNDAVQNLQQAVFKLNLPNLNSYCADRVSLSIGVAHFDECPSSVSLSESLQHADSALYHAKRGGRNQYAVSEVAKAEA
ncbi:putative GGDEF and TPR repeat domains protein [Vibrio nigripulchritudo SOn1]|uniref:diguanylate cyclase n=1 Tax=Vibrio nigripulchritudo SOn1 TaxID=1238450 RepID=A0AAV2VN84_9VIBR|nr:sensor domain-containing diguanylate cyclase [Vibrio nigripulchritudo]CCO46186.1 putative GGDEF and TPR repeat domains protein [Vibrio nigripulchritudo SOn1]